MKMIQNLRPVVKTAHSLKKTKLSYFITIPKIEDEGLLCFAEGDNHLPFSVKRFYYITDVAKGNKRGYHAHRKTRQVLFCIKGSITILLDNGYSQEKIVLGESNKGILLDTMMWHVMEDFTKDAVLLIAASENYDESDYIRDYDQFLKLAHRKMIQKYQGRYSAKQ